MLVHTKTLLILLCLPIIVISLLFLKVPRVKKVIQIISTIYMLVSKTKKMLVCLLNIFVKKLMHLGHLWNFNKIDLSQKLTENNNLLMLKIISSLSHILLVMTLSYLVMTNIIGKNIKDDLLQEYYIALYIGIIKICVSIINIQLI